MLVSDLDVQFKATNDLEDYCLTMRPLPVVEERIQDEFVGSDEGTGYLKAEEFINIVLLMDAQL
eukprot:11222246-Alexandrium_andersonii.AAC.1